MHILHSHWLFLDEIWIDIILRRLRQNFSLDLCHETLSEAVVLAKVLELVDLGIVWRKNWFLLQLRLPSGAQRVLSVEHVKSKGHSRAHQILLLADGKELFLGIQEHILPGSGLSILSLWEEPSCQDISAS